MPRPCTVCAHPKREEIDADMVAGTAFRNMAARFETSTSALFRHKGHVSATLALAHDAAEVVKADGLLDKVRALEVDARRIATNAESAGDLRTALAGVRELARIVELQGKLLGEIGDGSAIVNVIVAPEWLALRTAVLRALEPHVVARDAVVRALEGVNDAGAR